MEGALVDRSSIELRLGRLDELLTELEVMRAGGCAAALPNEVSLP